MTSEEVALMLNNLENRSKSNIRRIEKLELQTEAIQSLAMSVEIMVKEQQHQTEAMERIEDDVKKLDGKVEELEHKPAKQWESVVTVLITAVVTAVVTYILSNVGL